MALVPQGARILVSRQAPKETILPGGLIAPASAGAAKDPVERGEVVGVGDDATTFLREPGSAPILVLFKRSTGVEVVDGAARFYVVKVEDVLAVEAADS